MKGAGVFTIGVVCFVSGVVAGPLLAQSKLTFSADLVRGKPASEAAARLLDGALQLAESGSWERIAVGRAWYLGGDKAKGQQLFDSVTTGKKVASSDWFRIGRVYAEAKEWDQASAAFDRALSLKPDDDSGMIEYGALANLNKDRDKAEALFDRAMKKNPREFWHWVGAGGSYLGVPPPLSRPYGFQRIASRRLRAAMMSRWRRRTMSATRSLPFAAASSTIAFSFQSGVSCNSASSLAQASSSCSICAMRRTRRSRAASGS
jgi:tetratricopeptide (TPR) repeat protein